MSSNKSFSTETSERYSRALFEVLKEFNELEKAEINIRDFQLVLDNSLEFKNFINLEFSLILSLSSFSSSI